MIRRNSIPVAVAVLLYFCNIAGATEIDVARAHFNYMMYCQGCHQADARGSESAFVPGIKDYAGNFLKIEGGREFLVRVPGSANAVIDDAQLAELLNWILNEFAGDSLVGGFTPYTAAEVGKLRKDPLIEVNATRAQLVQQIELLKD